MMPSEINMDPRSATTLASRPLLFDGFLCGLEDLVEGVPVIRRYEDNDDEGGLDGSFAFEAITISGTPNVNVEISGIGIVLVPCLTEVLLPSVYWWSGRTSRVRASCSQLARMTE